MRTITFHQAGHDYACVDDTGAIVGVLKSFDDRFIIPHEKRVRKSPSASNVDDEIERAIREYAERKRKEVKT